MFGVAVLSCDEETQYYPIRLLPLRKNNEGLNNEISA